MEGNAKTERASIRILASVLVAGFSLIAWVPGAHAGPKGTDRPIEGACDNDITPLSPPGVFPVLLEVENTCHISHLGLTVGFTDSEVIVPAGPPVGTVLPVSITVTKMCMSRPMATNCGRPSAGVEGSISRPAWPRSTEPKLT